MDSVGCAVKTIDPYQSFDAEPDRSESVSPRPSSSGRGQADSSFHRRVLVHKRKSTRKPVSKRAIIAKRDGWVCCWCGRPLQERAGIGGLRLVDDAATLEHVVPCSLGGTNNIDNLKLSCPGCNSARGSNQSWRPDESNLWRSDE